MTSMEVGGCPDCKMDPGWYRLKNGDMVYVVGPEDGGSVMVSNYKGIKTGYVHKSKIVGKVQDATPKAP